MVDATKRHLIDGQLDERRVRLASVDDLSHYPDAAFDLVTCFGVLDYLRPEPGMEERALSEFRRVLKPNGLLWVDNVNELFDLTTFNRFTLAFFQRHFLPLFFPESSDQAEITLALRRLVNNPDAPERRSKWGTDRDKVAQVADNPLRFGRRMQAFGFDEIDQLYIRFHAVPPLLFADNPALERLTIEKEKELCRDWRGLFLASLFLSILRRRP
jgi:SAM-dependent methyltransferase